MSDPTRRRSWALTALFVAVLVAAAMAVPEIETDNDLLAWTDADARAQRDYDELHRVFGSDEFVLVTLGGGDLFDPSILDASLRASEALERIRGVERVFGAPILYRDVYGAEDAEALVEELSSTDFYTGLVVSEDLETTGIFLTIDPPDGAQERGHLVRRVRRAVAPLRRLGLEVRIVGPPVLTYELDRASLAEARRSLPLAGISSILLLALLLRSPRATLVPLACAATTLGSMVLLMALLRMPLNMFTSALPALLWVLSLAAILHLLMHYRHALGTTGPRRALQQALDTARFPCALSSLTTAAGFLSLNFAPMQPVRELGTLAGIGVLVSFAVSFTLGPALIDLLRPPVLVGQRAVPILQRVAEASWSRPVLAVAPFAVLSVVGFASLVTIQPSSNPLTFLPQSSRVLDDYRHVRENLSGMSAIEIVVPTPGGWTDPVHWPRLRDLEAVLVEEPSVTKIRSPLAVLAKLRQWDRDLEPEQYRLPDSRAEAERLVAEADPALRVELASLAAADGQSVRLSLLTSAMDSSVFARVEDHARGEAEARFGEASFVSGIVPLLVRAQERLVGSHLMSLGFAGLTVFLCILLGLRSLTWAVVSMAPNLVPIAGVLLIMAVARLPLDPGTLMIAGVALGIAVDDTVHLVTAIRRRAGLTARRAVGEAAARVGPALSITTTTASLGFLSLTVARFLPIRTFGLLTAFAMVGALAADLILLPGLLGLKARWGAEKEPALFEETP